jgi:hypothetical protein
MTAALSSIDVQSTGHRLLLTLLQTVLYVSFLSVKEKRAFKASICCVWLLRATIRACTATFVPVLSYVYPIHVCC